jgi:hypothetical protein
MECFALCGERPGLLALDLGSIFEKLLHQKAFIDSLSSSRYIQPLQKASEPQVSAVCDMAA